MNDDERFEHDLRATLDGLAHETAPDRLIDRVSEIPRQEHSMQHNPRPTLFSRGVGSAFGLLAAGVVIAVLAIVVRPGVGPGPAGGSGSPSLGIVPTASPSSTSPVAVVPSPSVEPSSSAGVATLTPTPSASSVPADFRPLSATFVSADMGWVLGSVPCDAARCPAIVRTDDGGTNWSSIGAPQTTVGSGPGPGLTATGISALRFANPLDGWAFGPQLWATHDGGATWTQIAIGGVPTGAPVTALETAKGVVHAVVYDQAQDFRIATSRVGADEWHLADVRVEVGAGPVPQAQLVLSGTGGWVLENNRTVTAGARLESGTWKAWQPVCLDVVGPAVLGASSSSDLVAACDVGTLSTPQGDHIYASHDGGTSFAQTGTKTPLDAATGIASPSRSIIVVAGSDPKGTALVASYDGGQTWKTVSSSAGVSFADLGFTTPTQGIVITIGQDGTSQMLMTHDAGRTWKPVGF